MGWSLGTLTLVQAVEDQVELLLRVLALMLLPAVATLAAQDHQLPLPPPQRRKVGDLHDDRSGGGRPEDTIRRRSGHREATVRRRSEKREKTMKRQ